MNEARWPGQFWRSTWSVCLTLLAVIGLTTLVWQALGVFGVVRPPLIAASYRSPGGEHCLDLISVDEPGPTVREVVFMRSGIHLFAGLRYYIKHGSVYGAKWESARKVIIFVAEDFSFENSIEPFWVNDGSGTFEVSVQKLRQI